MNYCKAALVAGLLSIANTAHAAVLDFSSSPEFDSTFAGLPVGGETTTTATVDGVTFTVVSLDSRGVDGFRQDTTRGGLSFGTPGNGMFEMAIIANRDIVLDGFTGIDFSVADPDGSINGPLVFDAFFGAGTSVVSNFSFSASGSTVDLGDTLMTAGTVLNFFTDYGETTGFTPRIGATLQSLEFSRAAPVPLPAGAPLLLVGIGAFSWMKRRKS